MHSRKKITIPFATPTLVDSKAASKRANGLPYPVYHAGQITSSRQCGGFGGEGWLFVGKDLAMAACTWRHVDQPKHRASRVKTAPNMGHTACMPLFQRSPPQTRHTGPHGPDVGVLGVQRPKVSPRRKHSPRVAYMPPTTGVKLGRLRGHDP